MTVRSDTMMKSLLCAIIKRKLIKLNIYNRSRFFRWNKEREEQTDLKWAKNHWANREKSKNELSVTNFNRPSNAFALCKAMVIINSIQIFNKILRFLLSVSPLFSLSYFSEYLVQMKLEHTKKRR